MNASISAILKRIIIFTIFINISFSQSSYQAIPQSAIQNDPNLDPNWDWRIGDDPSRIFPDAAYIMFHKGDNTIISQHYVQAPWPQAANATAGLLDCKKEDGWELLARDFGTRSRGVTGLNVSDIPYFVIYNKYRSIFRVFIFSQNAETWDKGFVEMQFQNPNDTTKIPAVLAHLKPFAEAVENYQTMKHNVTSVFSNILQKNVWLWADFPLSFDPKISTSSSMDPPRLYLRIYGQKKLDISLKGISQGVQGNINFINDWLTGAGQDYGNGSVGIPNLKMPNFNLSAQDINLGELNFKPFATHTTWNSFTNYFDKIKIKVPNVSVYNPFKGLFDGFSSRLSVFTSVLPISLPGLDFGGIFDFFVNGGGKVQAPAEPTPSYIAMNLEFNGTIKSTTPVHFIQITIPGTRDEYWKPTVGSPVGIVRNNPVGILSITKTPLINKKPFSLNNRINERNYVSYPMFEYELAEMPQISINENSGLELLNCMISIIAPVEEYSEPDKWIISKANTLNDQKHLIDFEAPISESMGCMRSLPVPIKYSKGRTLQLSSTTDPSTIKLKIKATMQRKDDRNTQPVVFIATYNVDIVENNGPAEQILPTIPPQNIKCLVPATGGVKISWERNLEKNIKHYAVERSINNGSFYQIGITADVEFIDIDVQKTVKAYKSNRQNVAVRYRVRALSEWTERRNWWNGNDTITLNQFSAYSDIINISGSIIGAFDKRSSGQIIPEANSLSQNFPNPFNPTTTIYYGIKEESFVTITIFNSLGQVITTLVNDKKEVGYHYAEWNATGLPSGIYFYRINAGKYSETHKMLMMK